MRSAVREWPVLLYRGTCPRCRVLSRAVVVASGLAVRRIANDTPEAAAVYAHHGVAAGKLALVHRGRIRVDRRVFAAVWWVIAACWLARIPGLGGVIHRGRGRGKEVAA
jgi:predicted DCC family thiol-disulfide oxidoreductase YuxK